MVATQDERARANRRRAHRSAAMHGLAVVIFGLLCMSGVAGVIAGAQALAVPMVIAGAGGAAGALVIAWSLLRRPDLIAAPRPTGRISLQGAARIGMAVAGAATAVAGAALAPDGAEHGFVIAVTSLTGCLLALFALFAGERGAQRQGPTRR